MRDRRSHRDGPRQEKEWCQASEKYQPRCGFRRSSPNCPVPRPSLPLAPFTPSFIVITFQSLRTKCSYQYARCRKTAQEGTPVVLTHMDVPTRMLAYGEGEEDEAG